MATNTAPTIANLQGDAATQVEGAGGTSFVDVGRDAVIADSDSTDFAGGRLTVAVTSGFQTNDHVGIFQDGVVALNFTTGAVTVNGIEIGTAAGGYITSPSSPALTIDFNANATPALVQTLLRGIFVRDPFTEPRSGARQIEVTLSDGDGGQSTYTTQLQVTTVNDAPAGTDSTLTVNEDQATALTAANFGFDQHGGSTASEGQVLQAVIVTTLPTAGTLYLDPDGAGTGSLGTAVTAGQSVSAADIAAGRLVYVPAANANGIGYASFTFQVQDSGGIANGGQDTDQSPNTLTFDVTAVNDLPVANPDSYSTAEDTPVQFSIASLLANDTDADGDAVRLVGFGSPQNGTYTANGGIVTFTPNQDFVGDATLDYTITDDNGGTSVGRATVTVAAINDAPNATAGLPTGIMEDQLHVLTTAEIVGSYSDPEGDAFTAIKITKLANIFSGDVAPRGTLFYDADGAGGAAPVAVTLNQVIGKADLDAGKLSFLSAPNDSGNPYGVFEYAVQDSLGAFDPSPTQVQYSVAPVNDAPTVTITPAPTLGGMGMITEWTDLETGSGELPASPWGTSDVDGANRIGLSVTFENGLAGSVIYDNVAGLWNSYFGGVAYESATGFFTAAQGLHFLFADGSTLPMAWEAFEMPFSGNFDLDYNNQNGSHFRADTGGWTSAVFRTFSSTAAGGGAGSYAATEQQASSLKGTIALADVDAGGGVVTATLAVGYGVLDVGVGTSGATVVSGNGTGSVVVSGTLAQLNALLGSDATSTVSFTPNTDAPPASTTLTVTVNDGGNTGGAAQTGSDSETIAITAVNDAPAADLNGAEGGIDAAASYTEDTGAVKLTPGIVLSDADSATLTGATVTIASGFVAGDVVRVGNGQSGTTTDGIAYSYNAATGVLTLSGSASVAAYQAALATLAFKTNSNTPGTARDIVVTVTDGAATSTAAHVALTVIPVNDAPTVANLQGDISTFTEGGGAFTTSLDVGLNALVSDPDNANFNGGSLNIAVTGGVAAEDFIYFNNGNPAFGLTFSGNTIRQGGVAFATFNAPGADRTFTFLSDGSATPARVEQLIRSLTYHNSNQANPSEGAHTVTYTLTDGSGGTSITTATVNVVGVNDAPVADLNGAGGGIDTSASYTEGASGVKLAPAIVVSDPDGTLTGATATIASGFVAGDILRLSGGQNGTTSDGISFSYNGATGVLTLSGSASVAAYQAALATLGFKSNSTDPGPSRDITVTVTDGSLTSTAAHVTVTITEVADAPAASAFSFAALPELATTGDYGLSMFSEEETPASAVEFAFVSGEQGDFANPAILFDPAFADLML